ncbi:MAG: 16S rRNA (guanine(527)-N(7))-methyltransferase RsmG [Eggerthellaceae bacterium]|nr:16S rRNA (guanine(527)-N(7))-methyltransferase RsmG [Eggerthellaceae bacterium]
MSDDEMIALYLDLILEANKTVNLTRIGSLDQARILHVQDSLSALPEINAAPQGLYGDLGTGGGFPGVPVSIKTGREAVLVDSVKKKAAVIEEALSKLSLSGQIKTYPGRIEDLALEKRSAFAVLTARALSQLPSLLELSSPLLVKGGRLVCYKARLSEDELNHAESLEKILGMKLVSRRSLTLSDGETYREIVSFEKVAKAKIKLPRRISMAQKKPLTV